MNSISLFLSISTLFILIGRGTLFSLSWVAVKHGGIDVSVVAGTYWWSYVLGLPVLGALGDASRQRTALLLATLANSTAIVLIAMQAHDAARLNVREMLPGLAVVALTFSFVNPLSGKMLYRYAQRNKLQVAFKTKGWLDSIASLSAPAMGGWLIYCAGEPESLACYAVASIFLLFITALLCRSGARDEPARPGIALGVSVGLSDFMKGAKMVVKVKTEFLLAIYMMTLNFTITPFLTVVLPVYVGHTLKKSSYDLGLISSSFGAGMVAGGLLALMLHGLRRNINLLASLGGILLIALGFLGCALFKSIPALGVCLALSGVGVALFNGVVSAQRAVSIPDEVRSKFESFMLFSTSLSIPLGVSITGYATKFVSLSALTLAFATLGLLMVPLLIAIPRYRGLMHAREGTGESFYSRSYSSAFPVAAASNSHRSEI